MAPALGARGVLSFLRQQLNLLVYGMRPLEKIRTSPDQNFGSNEAFWKALREKRVLTNSVVHLHEFAVTEWLPRTPGLYHDPSAETQRHNAESFQMSSERFLHQTNRPGKRIGLSRSDSGHRHPASVIYDPYGKSLMIEGGIGCVRLKDIHLPQGRTWFLGATSSEGVHEGIPIALSDQLHRMYIADIAKGGFTCDLTARVRCIPDVLDRMYQNLPNIPKVYLEVEERLRPIRQNQRLTEFPKGSWVTGALGFRVAQARGQELLATFTSFVNGDPSSLKEAVEWIEEVYVNDVFKGEVVTDFDQQETRFRGAVFSIDSLFANAIDVKQARQIILSFSDQRVSDEIIKEMSRATVKMEVNMDQRVTIGRGARVIDSPIAVGGSNITINSQINRLSEQLQEEIAKGIEKIPRARAKVLADDAKKLRRQLNGKKPKKSSVLDTLNGIAKTAKAVGTVGAPILKLAGSLMSALG